MPYNKGVRRLLLVPATLALTGVTIAQTFPPVPKSGTVFDGANLLSADQERTISNLARDFRRDTGAPVAVATLSSLERYEAKSLGIQKYGAALFNQWRVGSKKANGGILLVVAKADRKVWVALGSDWGHKYDAKTQKIVRGTITPSFKQGKFGEGIVKGCQALVHLADSLGNAAGNQESTGESVMDPDPFGAPPPEAMPFQGSSESGFLGGGVLCFVLPFLLFVFIAIAARRRNAYRPYGRSFGPGSGGGPGPNAHSRYDDPRDDSGDFLTGMIVGQAMSQPSPVYDPNPFDNGPGYGSSPSFDSGSSDSSGSSSGGFDSGSSDSSSSDSGGSFDSGSSDGGGGGGDW